eukprot:6689559-Karenia_brevis.AAC.1
MQTTTEELKVLQASYAQIVQLSGESSPAALNLKKLLESHSNKLTPCAVAMNHKSLWAQQVEWEQSKNAKIKRHRQLMEAKNAELETLKTILEGKEKEIL